MKPLTPEVHKPISDWVRAGGTLVFVDADTDPYLRVRDWWNTGGMSYATPREHLFEQMGLPKSPTQQTTRVGAGRVVFLHRSPTELSRNADGAKVVADIVRKAASNLHWSESAAFILRRGPYVVGAGMDETGLPDRTLHGHFVNLFDPELKAVNSLTLTPSSRFFLVDLDRYQGRVIASAGQVIQAKSDSHEWSGTIEGMSDTRSVILLRATSAPKEATLDGRPISEISYDSAHHLAYLRFPNQPRPQKVEVRF
jgi:hypothetical protein